MRCISVRCLWTQRTHVAGRKVSLSGRLSGRDVSWRRTIGSKLLVCHQKMRLAVENLNQEVVDVTFKVLDVNISLLQQLALIENSLNKILRTKQNGFSQLKVHLNLK